MTDANIDVHTDTPMAKLLSPLLMVAQWTFGVFFVLLLLMALIMAFPSGFRESLLEDAATQIEPMSLMGRCLAGAVVTVGWFFVLKLLRGVVKAVMHGRVFRNWRRRERGWVALGHSSRDMVFHFCNRGDFRSFPLWRCAAGRSGIHNLMTIKVNLDRVLLDRKMSLTELAERVGITLANLSILKTGKARAVRFSTLDLLCRELDCQPADILVYEPEEEVETTS